MLYKYSTTCVLKHHGADQWNKCPNYQDVLIFQVSLHARGYFETVTKCPDYTGILNVKCPD